VARNKEVKSQNTRYSEDLADAVGGLFGKKAPPEDDDDDEQEDPEQEPEDGDELDDGEEG